MKEVCPKCGKSPCQCEEMDEELKGNQKKLDKNHNGKLDAQDFKMLRKEEVEQIEEGDLSVRHLYNKFADASANGHDTKPAEKAIKKVHGDEVLNHMKRASAANARGDFDGEGKHFEKARAAAGKTDRIGATVGKGRSEFRKMHKEEVEQIDEISQETKDAYIRKADKQVTRTDLGYGKRHGGLPTKNVSVDDFKRKYQNRKAGIKQAMEEEVKLSAEELARIEEINNNLDEVVTARKLTPADKKARAEYLAKHAEKLKQHETGIESPKKSFKDVNTERGDYTHQPSKMGIKHSIGSGYYKND
jgi:hypothetical protein